MVSVCDTMKFGVFYLVSFTRPLFMSWSTFSSSTGSLDRMILSPVTDMKTVVRSFVSSWMSRHSSKTEV